MRRRSRCRPPMCVALLALTVPFAIACGGDDPTLDDVRAPLGDTTLVPGDTLPPDASADSPAPAVDPVVTPGGDAPGAGDTPDRGNTSDRGDTPSTGGTPDRGDTPGAGEDPGSSSALPPWTTGIVSEGESARGLAEVGRIRLGRDPGFDRVVLDFNSEQLPGFRASYIDKPLRECGSGNQIHPVGDGWLEIRLEPARAHTEEGEAILTPTRSAESLALVERIYRTCDFEGVVTLVLAVQSPNPFRIFTLREPARLVVDVRR